MGPVYFSVAAKEQDPILRFLEPNPNLPANLQAAAEIFSGVALQILERCERSAERTMALRKLLEAKDCTIRAML